MRRTHDRFSDALSSEAGTGSLRNKLRQNKELGLPFHSIGKAIALWLRIFSGDGRQLAHFVLLMLEKHREQDMGLRLWLFVAIMGGLAQLILSMADREISAGVDRLSELENMHDYVQDADPNLKLASERSPYMRDER